MNTIAHFRKCTLTNNELLAKVDYGTDQMYQTGRIPDRQIPARPNEDYDLVVGELILRFQALEKENSDLRAQLGRVKKGELRLEKIKKRLIERFRVEEGDEEWDSISFFAIREIIEQEFTTSSPSKEQQ